jgi:hypothetical protein
MVEKKFKIRLNSVEKVEAILQEIYDDSVRQMNLIQEKINELKESGSLADEPIDMKAKYAKAMHDYITDKEKSIGRKLDVSKLMSEVLKFNGDVGKAMMSEKETLENLSGGFENIRNMYENGDTSNEDKEKPEIYITNKFSPKK